MDYLKEYRIGKAQLDELNAAIGDLPKHETVSLEFKKESFTVYDPISKIADILDVGKIWESELNDAVERAPNTLKALQLLQEKLEKAISKPENHKYNKVWLRKRQALIYNTYQESIRGIDKPLFCYNYDILEYVEVQNKFRTYSGYIDGIALGWFFAHFEERLKQKIKEIEDENFLRQNIMDLKSPIHLVGWMHELGVIELLFERFGKRNIKRAAEVIHSIVKYDPVYNPEKIRSTISAMYSANRTSNTNNPFNYQQFRDNIENALNEFKIKKREKSLLNDPIELNRKIGERGEKRG